MFPEHFITFLDAMQDKNIQQFMQSFHSTVGTLNPPIAFAESHYPKEKQFDARSFVWGYMIGLYDSEHKVTREDMVLAMTVIKPLLEGLGYGDVK